MKRDARKFILAGCALFLFSLSAQADLITNGFTFAVADDCEGSGSHFHSSTGGDFGNPAGKAEVGRYFCEEVRGLSEYNVTGLGTALNAFMTFDVFDDEGLFPEYPGSFIGDITIEAYSGNNSEGLSDFNALVEGVVGSFSTAGLMVGNTLSFDITSIYNDAIDDGLSSIGMRLRTNPLIEQGAWTFDTFRLTTTNDTTSIPEPGTLALLGIGLFGMGLVRRMRKA